MKLEINITKKYAFLIIGAILLAGGIFLVNAYGGTQPKVVGHSSGEVDVNIGGTIKTLQEAINAGDFNSWSSITGMPAGFVDGIDSPQLQRLEIHLS